MSIDRKFEFGEETNNQVIKNTAKSQITAALGCPEFTKLTSRIVLE